MFTLILATLLTTLALPFCRAEVPAYEYVSPTPETAVVIKPENSAPLIETHLGLGLSALAAADANHANETAHSLLGPTVSAYGLIHWEHFLSPWVEVSYWRIYSASSIVPLTGGGTQNLDALLNGWLAVAGAGFDAGDFRARLGLGGTLLQYLAVYGSAKLSTAEFDLTSQASVAYRFHRSPAWDAWVEIKGVTVLAAGTSMVALGITVSRGWLPSRETTTSPDPTP